VEKGSSLKFFYPPHPFKTGELVSEDQSRMGTGLLGRSVQLLAVHAWSRQLFETFLKDIEGGADPGK
tara:strand:- start:4593 stop:4793 length:201 start_codon:yes stop_codon:yes gene_type:complete